MKALLLFLMLAPVIAGAQQRWSTRQGTISFEASVPSFEEVKATSTAASCTLDSRTSHMQASVRMRSFAFKRDLMKQHFNDHYVESDHYPRAVLKGTLEGINPETVSSSPRPAIVRGKLTIHGKTRKVTIPVQVTRQGEAIRITSSFNIKLSDYHIAVPSLVRSKIAETVRIDAAFDLHRER